MISKKQQYRYDLIFDGNIRNGFTYEQVTQLLKEHVQLKDEYISSLFAGKTRVCSNKDYDTVLKWHKKFFAAGIDLKLKLQQPSGGVLISRSAKANSDKAKARQIRTIARVKELPLSTAQKSRFIDKTPRDSNNKNISLKQIEAQLRAFQSSRNKPLNLLSALAVVCLLALVPLLYFAVIAGLVGAIAWAITDMQAYFGNELSDISQFLIYLMPILLIAPFVFLMLKPLFAFYPKQERILLEQDQHKPLYGIFELLAKALQVRKVDKIWVGNTIGIDSNFRLGLSTGFSVERSITLGMPIMASLNVEQLVALCAYEMSFTGKNGWVSPYHYIRRLDAWLYKRAWNNDRMDLFLDNVAMQTDSLIIGLLVWIFKAYNAAARSCLRLIYAVYHRVCLKMAKPVVVNAVLEAESIAGSKKVKQTCLELKKLKLAESEISVFNKKLIQAKRLLENIPLAIAHFKYQYGVPLEKKIEEAKPRPDGISQFWFNEVDLPKTENAQGVFCSANPASELLPHFELLCYEVTSYYYRREGVEENESAFVSDAAILTERGAGGNTFSALDTFFNGLYSQWRILFFASDRIAKNGLMSHQALVDQIRWKTLDFKSALKAMQDWKRKYVLAKLGQAYTKAGIKIIPNEYALSTLDSKSVSENIRLYEHRMEKTNHLLKDMDLLFRKRIDLCIDKMQDVDKKNAAWQLKALESMVKFIPWLEQLQRSTEILELLLLNSIKNSDVRLNDTIRLYRQQIQSNFYKIVLMSRDIRRVDQKKSLQSLREFLTIKLGNNIDQILDVDAKQSVQYGKLLIRSFYQWYVPALSEITCYCESLEKEKSIKPLKLVV